MLADFASEAKGDGNEERRIIEVGDELWRKQCRALSQTPTSALRESVGTFYSFIIHVLAYFEILIPSGL